MYLTSIEEKNPITINNSIQPVGYNEHRARLELFPDCFLDKGISSDIHCCSCFIKNENL